jgi:glutaminase
MQAYLENLILENRHWTSNGNVANYIPELGKADGSQLGICIRTLEGDKFCAGDYQVPFTIQSVSKPLVLLLALMDQGEQKVFEKVGMEPTGDPFNSMIRLETFDNHKPYNPMINAGAIAVAGMIKGQDVEERLQRIVNLLKKLAGGAYVGFNEDVYYSEKRTGNRNRAMAYFMKEFGIIENDVEETLDLYFRQCSIEMTCEGIANAALILANGGIDPETGSVIVPKRFARVSKTFMMTCGMYDASGEFAMNVGVPAKSGVGGGILCAVPKRLGVGVFGPALDQKGNSIAGIKILESLSKKYDLSLF